MKQQSRLDRLEGSLTPREAVWAWLQETKRDHPTLIAYVGWLKDEPLASYPLVRLPEQVKAAVRDRLKGRHYQEVAVAERQAVRDVAYLLHLVLACNRHWYEHGDRFRLAFLLLHEKLGRLLYEGPEGPLGKRHGSEWARYARRWVSLADTYLSELGCLDRAFRRLGEQAMGDEAALLSADAASDLAAQLGRFDDLVELYNTAVWDRLPKQLKQSEQRAQTLAELEPGLAEPAEQQMVYLKDRAKAEVLRLMGDENAAADVMGRYVQ